MKLIYQHMLSFLVVILTTLAIVSYSISKSNEKLEYERTWTYLESYGNSLGELALKIDPQTHEIKNITSGFVKDLEEVLKGQAVQFAVFDNDNNQTYPQNSQNIHLNKKVWEQIRKKKIVREETDHGANSPKFKDKSEMTFVIVPWYMDHKFVGAVWIGAKVSHLQTNILAMQKNMRMAFIISLIASVILSFILAKYYASRINRLRAATQKVAANDFDVSINSKGRDELDDLAEDFNSMVSSLKASSEEVARQEQRRQEFMANASHEMKTPLTTINGILEGLKYDAIPEDMKDKSIDLMRNETNRLIRLVSENLDYEKIRTNQIPLNKTRFNAVETLINIVSQLKNKSEENGDIITFKHEENDIPVYADYDRFVQIFFNIIQNAIQFTENGEIKVSITKLDDAVLITVSDNGIGMNKDQVKNIWDRYYKADPSRKATKGESGLGLAIVHQLIEMHKGKVSVESEPGIGTSFVVKLYDKNHFENNNF